MLCVVGLRRRFSSNVRRRLQLSLMLMGLTGCTTTNNIVVVARPPAPRPSPCAVPAGSPAIKPTGLPLVQTNPVWPPEVVARRVASCVGILFQLTPDGSPINQRIAIEYPPNNGLSTTALNAIAGDKFRPPQNSSDWHYWIYMVNFVAQPAH